MKVTQARGCAIAGALLVTLGIFGTCVGPEMLAGFERERRAMIKNDLFYVHRAVVSFARANLGRDPESLELLLLSRNSSGAYSMLPEQILNGWGRAYLYVPSRDGNPRQLTCLGRDGELGGDGMDRDTAIEDYPGYAERAESIGDYSTYPD